MDGLKDRYKTEVAPALVEKLELGNVMRVPRVTKVVVNMGFGVADKDVIKRLTEEDAEFILSAINELNPRRKRSEADQATFRGDSGDRTAE